MITDVCIIQCDASFSQPNDCVWFLKTSFCQCVRDMGSFCADGDVEASGCAILISEQTHMEKKPNLNQKGRRRWSGVGGSGFCYHDELNKLKPEREKRCGRTYTGMQRFIRINTTFEKIEGKFEHIKMHLLDHNWNKAFSCYRKGRPLLFIISK